LSLGSEIFGEITALKHKGKNKQTNKQKSKTRKKNQPTNQTNKLTNKKQQRKYILRFYSQLIFRKVISPFWTSHSSYIMSHFVSLEIPGTSLNKALSAM
jgi:hypothetical protein